MWIMPKYRFGDFRFLPVDHVISDAPSVKGSKHSVVVNLPYFVKHMGNAVTIVLGDREYCLLSTIIAITPL